MSPKFLRILLAALAGAAGSTVASGEVSGDVATILNVAVTAVGVLAPLFAKRLAK